MCMRCAVLLQKLAFAEEAISSIRSWDEAIVIAVALSLSSSAFVLQLLGDKGQLASRCAPPPACHACAAALLA